MKKFLTAIVLSFSLASCSPGIGPNLSIENIPEKQVARKWDSFQPVPKVKVNKFLDSRQNVSLGTYDGQELKAQGDLGLGVQRAFEEQLKASGARLALFDAIEINGEVTSLSVQIEQAFPAVEVTGEAEIALQILDLQGNPVFKARYAGSFSEKNPFFSQEKVEGVLG